MGKMTPEKQEEYMERITRALEGIEQELGCMSSGIMDIWQYDSSRAITCVPGRRSDSQGA